MIVRDARSGGFARVSRTFTEELGYAAQELADRPLMAWIQQEDRAPFQRVLDAGQGVVQARHLTRSGQSIAFDWRVRSEEDGPVVLGVLQGANRAASETRATRIGRPQNTMAEILGTMCLIVEGQHPGMKCSVLLLDDSCTYVSVGGGPSLPTAYNEAIEGLMIGPYVGSCGAAAYWNERIVVEDIQKDPLWVDLRGHAAKAGLGACWSHPITAKSGKVLGAAALYDPEPRAPTQQQLDALAAAARMFGLAIERGYAERALQKSEAVAQLQSRLLSAVTSVVTSFIDTGDWTSAGSQLVRAAVEMTSSEYGFLGEAHGSELRVLSHHGIVWSAHQGRTFYEEAVRSYEEQGYLVFPRLDNLFGHVITSGQPVLSNDAKEDQRSGNRIPDGHPELRSFLGVPITNGGKVVAMIGVANAKDGYSGNDTRNLEFLCQAGTVVFDSHLQSQREAELEERLHQAAKMEALGVLAGGLAHDFNNLLTTVLGNAELAMMTLPEDADEYSMLREIETASRSASGLCNQMLAYAGRGALSKQRLECNGLIKEFGGLLQVTLSKKASIEYQLCEDDLFVEADKAQFGQVVMNLVTNGAEALGNDVGRVLVITGMRYFGRNELDGFQPNASLVAGEYVCLTVADTGSGMTAETQTNIFDPFFTTKFAGRGLGLAAVQGIIRRHQGGIRLETALGKGTTFTVLFPRAEAPRMELDQREEIVRPHMADGRVLVVDDEPQVRKVLAQILESEGFEVVRARDGREAIEVFGREKDAVDCVLLDLSMPELDGEETFRELQRIRSDVPVILISGFTEQEILNRFKGSGFAGALQKPTPRRELIEKIHDTISNSRLDSQQPDPPCVRIQPIADR